MAAKQVQPAAPAAPNTTIKAVEDPPHSAQATEPPPQPAPSAEVEALRQKVAELQQGAEHLRRMVDQKNERIADLEETVAKQAKQIGEMVAAGLVAEVKAGAKGLTEEEFAAARAAGCVNFLVLESKGMWDGSRFERGLGIDARQWPQLALYVHHGLALAALPNSGGGR
jgi:hypothetical protein